MKDEKYWSIIYKKILEEAFELLTENSLDVEKEEIQTALTYISVVYDKHLETLQDEAKK